MDPRASTESGGLPATRRDVLDLALKAGIAVGACGMAVPACLYLLPARSRGPKDAFVDAGAAGSFQPGDARVVQGEGKPILVLCLEPNRFRAFSAICTHLGCIVKWDSAERKILCPCHAGVFGPDGAVISGPPRRPLPEYPVLVKGQTVQVKT